MLTKTFRAPNMLTALKNVQAELGADALILSMREVPSGPIWAAWRKPGVEVIASKSEKSTEKIEALPKPSSESLKEEKHTTPTQEELKREIENLKMLVTGQKVQNPSENNTTEPKVVKPKESQKFNANVETRFDFTDFKHLPEAREPQLEEFSAKTKSILAKTETVIIEKAVEEIIPPQLLEIKRRLVAQGVNADIIDKIITTNLDALSPAILEDYNRLDRFIKHQLVVCLPPSRKSIALVPSKVMVLTGSSGCGKTSCCAKLASFYMITMGKKVVWIEADTVRTSAIAEARTYTETLGIPLFLAYTPQELSELIESQKDADLILVDTAGCNPRSEDNIIELGSLLSSVPSGSTYLVASATTKEQDMFEVEKTLSQFGLKGTILTKMDETGSFGSSFNLLWKCKLPVYFYSIGIKIFGNLKPGNPDLLADAIIDGEFQQK